MITLIWAQDKKGGIGKDNKLPWNIKEEMQHFRATTTNKTIVMGRKTFESIGRPLPNRVNIVLTKNANWKHDGVIVFNDIKELLNKYKGNDLYVIGGKEIYNLFLPYANQLIISKINNEYECDTFMDFDLSKFALNKTDKFDKFNVEYYKD